MLTTTALHGSSIVNGASRAGKGAAFQGVDPATGEKLDPVCRCATIEDLNVAADLADEAFLIYRKTTGRERLSQRTSMQTDIASASPTRARRHSRSCQSSSRT